jgi:FkbM family methyltransferase
MILDTYFWYFYEYIKHGDFQSVYAAAKYILFKKSLNKDRIIQTSVGKFFCRKNTNDFQFANFRYEWGVKKFILNHIHEYSVFIDAGSCTGDYAILLTNYNIRSIAFEPIAANYQVLIKNLELNNMIRKVKAFQVGLGDENKLVSFKFDQVNTGASHLNKEDPKVGCQVELRQFDSFLTELNLDKNEKILFKMDVEGMEPEVLKGAANFIRQYPNITFVLEEKFTGGAQIKSVLNELGRFEYGMVDKCNMYARKIV